MKTNKQTGYEAEDKAKEYLENLGYTVIDSNWHNKWAEIDIIATKDNTVYFVEVKYRKNSSQGFGMDYITPKKVKQMSFAAEMWVSDNRWNGQYQLSAISIDDSEITFIKDI